MEFKLKNKEKYSSAFFRKIKSGWIHRWNKEKNNDKKLNTLNYEKFHFKRKENNKHMNISKSITSSHLINTHEIPIIDNSKNLLFLPKNFKISSHSRKEFKDIKKISIDQDNEIIQKQTGYSINYIYKLKRKKLKLSKLQLRQPIKNRICNNDIHVILNNNDKLFIKKELCQILSICSTTFSYWKIKVGVEQIKSSKNFKIMTLCRNIFGGRSTYTLYTSENTLKILNEIKNSRQNNIHKNENLYELIKLVDFFDKKK